MAPADTTPPEHVTANIGALLPRIALALLGVVLFLAALLLIRSDPAWRLGQAVWPAGIGFGEQRLPMGVSRALTWLLLASWIGLGPASLVRAARPWAWLLAGSVSVLVLLLAGWWWALLACAGGFALAYDRRWGLGERLRLVIGGR